jgi:hypothetical protein|tara:strand:+ start:667 stop:1065 length:399 start_codon:yes stop_codon:yes gene_type:complete
MRDLTKRLEQMSNQFNYEAREDERKAIIKEHLMQWIEDSQYYTEYTLQDIANDPNLIHQHYIFNEWMIYSSDIYLFFDRDLLLVANDFMQEYGATEKLIDYLLIDYYAHRILIENINQWAEEEAERAATKPL